MKGEMTLATQTVISYTVQSAFSIAVHLYSQS